MEADSECDVNFSAEFSDKINEMLPGEIAEGGTTVTRLPFAKGISATEAVADCFAGTSADPRWSIVAPEG